MGEGGTVSVIITKLVGVLVGVEVRVSVAVGVYVFVGVLDVLVGVGGETLGNAPIPAQGEFDCKRKSSLS